MSTPKFFDVHTHTQFAAYENDSKTVIERALNQGVWMINVGTQRDTSKKAVEVASQYAGGVYATVGLHPLHTSSLFHDEKELGALSIGNEIGMSESESTREEFDDAYYKKLAQDIKVVAIGECGLDYYRITSKESRIKQREVFEKHIELASEAKKPLMIHCRGAFSDLIDVLSSMSGDLSSPSGVIHFFSGTVDDANNLLGLGFSFSFGGVITFTRDYDEQIKCVPMERILLETDAPYVAPVPHRGKRNEPSYIIEVARKVAELKALSLEEIAEKTTRNALSLFNLS